MQAAAHVREPSPPVPLQNQNKIQSQLPHPALSSHFRTFLGTHLSLPRKSHYVNNKSFISSLCTCSVITLNIQTDFSLGVGGGAFHSNFLYGNWEKFHPLCKSPLLCVFFMRICSLWVLHDYDHGNGTT